MELLNKTAEDIHPTRDRVLLEAAISERTASGLIVDPALLGNIRYPELGWVVESNTNKVKIAKNDLVLLKSHSSYADRTYYDVFSITLGDYKEKVTILVDSVIEPTFKQNIEAFRVNPSTDDRNFSVQDVESGEWYTFAASDVLDWGYVDLATPSYWLEYVPTYMIWLSQGVGLPLLLHYIIDYRNILAILKEA